jgi:hypothetical protein
MLDLSQQSSDWVSFSLFPLTLGGLGILSLHGGLGGPRAGPGRALRLFVSTWVKPMRGPVSVRKKELEFVNNQLEQGTWSDRYLAVTGPKGVGKSRLLETALSHKPGVVYVKVQSGWSSTEVVMSVMREVTNVAAFSFLNPTPSFKRVLWWYRLLGRQSPVVVLQLAERRPEHSFADVAGIVRDLADIFGLRVIIDAPPNSLDSMALETGRCDKLEVDFMTEAEIESVPEFDDAKKWLKEAELYVLAQELFSGSPLEWTAFINAARSSKFETRSPVEKKELIGVYILSRYHLLSRELGLKESNDPGAEAVAKKFFENGEVLKMTPALQRPQSDKIFRLVGKESSYYLQPASSFIYYALKYEDKIKTLEDLKECTNFERSRRALSCS